VANAPSVSRWKERLTLTEAADYLSRGLDRPTTAIDVLRLVQEEVLQLQIQFLDTIYGECIGVAPPYDEGDDAVRHPLPDGEVFDLPLIGAARLAVEEARRRQMGEPALVLTHTDAMLVDDDIGNRFRLYHRPGDYSPVTRLPDHALLLVRRDVLDQFIGKREGNERVDRPFGKRERETLYAMIAALVPLAKLDVRQPSAFAKAIETETTRLLGDPIPLRTVQDTLKRVRELFGAL
jgi:hypothetical protein